MADDLEGTSEFNRHHRMVTGEVPITVADSVVDMFTQQPEQSDAKKESQHG
jgi:hypothetical protein